MAITCEHCGNKLGELVAGQFVIRFHRREYIVDRVIAARCERCGTIYRPQRERPVQAGATTP